MAGRKRTHWIWFVFPQVEGLGHSAMSQRYAIKSKAEAVAYLAHPLLGTRLVECSRAVLSVADRSAHEIFGSPDDVKYRSSMTLFDTVDAGSLFRQCWIATSTANVIRRHSLSSPNGAQRAGLRYRRDRDRAHRVVLLMPARHPETPDGRYFVAKGRLWRLANPSLENHER